MALLHTTTDNARIDAIWSKLFSTTVQIKHSHELLVSIVATRPHGPVSHERTRFPVLDQALDGGILVRSRGPFQGLMYRHGCVGQFCCWVGAFKQGGKRSLVRGRGQQQIRTSQTQPSKPTPHRDCMSMPHSDTEKLPFLGWKSSGILTRSPTQVSPSSLSEADPI